MMASVPEADTRETALFRRNVEKVRDAVRAGMFAPALEAAARMIVNESKRRDRPLAWNDVTGNLRASISFQVEGRTKPRWIASLAVSGPDEGAVYNTAEYRSGQDRMAGEYAIVYAPPEYAVHVEAKSSRSVLLEPAFTVRDALFGEIADAGKKAWLHLALNPRAFGIMRNRVGA